MPWEGRLLVCNKVTLRELRVPTETTKCGPEALEFGGLVSVRAVSLGASSDDGGYGHPRRRSTSTSILSRFFASKYEHR